MNKKRLYDYLDRHPVYVNGVNLRFILELHSSVQSAMERGELDETEVAFVKYTRGFLGGVLSFSLLIVAFACFIFPMLLSRLSNDLATAVLFFAAFFIIFFIPNRILHRTLKIGRFENDGVKIVRFLVKVAYVFGCVGLAILLFLAAVFLIMAKSIL